MVQAPSITILSVSLESWLTILAILVGPLAALTIQKWMEDRRVKLERKMTIFRALMANRTSRLSATYVQALNGIETEFYEETKIIEAWHSLIDQLNTPQDPANDPNAARWSERVTNLLTDLLYEMAELLGYHFDKVGLKKNAYYPIGWNTIEIEQAKLRQAAIGVLEGGKPIKVEVTNPQP
jgi:hypothetical protein